MRKLTSGFRLLPLFFLFVSVHAVDLKTVDVVIPELKNTNPPFVLSSRFSKVSESKGLWGVNLADKGIAIYDLKGNRVLFIDFKKVDDPRVHNFVAARFVYIEDLKVFMVSGVHDQRKGRRTLFFDDKGQYQGLGILKQGANENINVYFESPSLVYVQNGDRVQNRIFVATLELGKKNDRWGTSAVQELKIERVGKDFQLSYLNTPLYADPIYKADDASMALRRVFLSNIPETETILSIREYHDYLSVQVFEETQSKVKFEKVINISLNAPLEATYSDPGKDVVLDSVPQEYFQSQTDTVAKNPGDERYLRHLFWYSAFSKVSAMIPSPKRDGSVTLVFEGPSKWHPVLFGKSHFVDDWNSKPLFQSIIQSYNGNLQISGEPIIREGEMFLGFFNGKYVTLKSNNLADLREPGYHLTFINP